MLESIDRIQWECLNHAYGTAEAVPELLHAIAFGRGEKQAAAIDDFGNKICHQGSSYEATAPCVPFICEIIRSPQVPQRHRLVSLLLAIAIGLDSDQLHDGQRITDSLDRLKQEAKEWPSNKRRPTGWGPFVILDGYSAVQQAIPELLALLSDGNRLVRIHTGYLLPWFPAKRRQALKPLRDSLTSAKRWDELANAILCVGLLEWQAAAQRTSRELVRPLLNHRREEVRYAAAIYLSWHDPTDDVRDILRELSANDDYEGNAPVPFNEYNLTGFARDQLSRAWGEKADIE